KNRKFADGLQKIDKITFCFSFSFLEKRERIFAVWRGAFSSNFADSVKKINEKWCRFVFRF
ncbi:MAG: hypothetical protein RBQ94_01360, partial [Methanimicrococcus sp.]|nr:hypothetical protein [Methanimicrococcus sp.]